MEQPVRVSLTFPRSGQKLYVHVPRYWAQPTEADNRATASLRLELSQCGPNRPLDDEPSRKP